jgi:hypothetical protein
MAKIGEIGLETSSGTVKLPVYETADFSNAPILKVQTPSGTGGFNLVDPTNSDATPVKVQTSSGVKAVATVGPSGGSKTATVDATLNSQSATVTVYEDTTGDGTADNTKQINVADGTNDYSLSNFSGGTGNNYWIDVELHNSNIEKTAEINSIQLSV